MQLFSPRTLWYANRTALTTSVGFAIGWGIGYAVSSHGEFSKNLAVAGATYMLTGAVALIASRTLKCSEKISRTAFECVGIPCGIAASLYAPQSFYVPIKAAAIGYSVLLASYTIFKKFSSTPQVAT